MSNRIRIVLKGQNSGEYTTQAGETRSYWKLRANAVSKKILELQEGRFEVRNLGTGKFGPEVELILLPD